MAFSRKNKGENNKKGKRKIINGKKRKEKMRKRKEKKRKEKSKEKIKTKPNKANF